MQLADKKILVVDDQRPFQLMLKGILLSLGARFVTLVSSGESAISACKNNEFDFFFIDYNLGATGKNGRQLLEEIKCRKLMKPDSLFLIVTGESHRPMVLGALENQPDDYLMKPFSQNLLKKRLEKSYTKKVFHRDIFIALQENNVTQAITESRRLLEIGSRYQNYGIRLLSELLCKNKQYNDAEKILTASLKNKRLTWCILQLAHVYYFQKKYDKTIELINEVTLESPLHVEAYDILAKAYNKQEKTKLAFDTVTKACELSPYSIKRQYFLADMARQCSQYDVIKNCTKTILDLSRRAFNQKQQHVLNYVRSAVDASEFAEDKNSSNRCQQEASLAIQRCKNEDAIRNNFKYDDFATLCNARIEALTGHHFIAKKHFYNVVKQYGDTVSELPVEMMPDAFTLLLQIGDFEQAGELIEPLEKLQSGDPYLASCLEHRKELTQDNRESFNVHNTEGIKAYTAGQYAQSIDSFVDALQYAPMHTSGALNLIQSIIKQLDSLENEDYNLVKLLHKTTRIVEGIKLPNKQHDKYDKLKPQIKKYSPKSVC